MKPLADSAVKSELIVSAAIRAELPSGSTFSVTWPNFTPRNGAPSASRTPMIGTANRIGRFMTRLPSRAQPRPSSPLAARLRHGIANLSTRWPRMPSSAGSSVSETTAAMATADMPP